MKFKVVCFLFLFSTIAVGQPNFTSPIDVFPDLGGYRGYGWNLGSLFHTSDDYASPVGANVLAVLDGEVVYNQTASGFGALNAQDCGANISSSGSNSCPGGAIVLKHTDSNGDIFFALYGHLQNRITKTAGQTILQGEKLGEVSDFWNNGDFLPHLHFGIYTGTTFPTSAWGYTSSLTGWVDPEPFLSSLGSCFSIFGAAVNATSTTFEDLEVGFWVENNCGQIKVLQNIAVSFHDYDNPDDFVKTCFKPNPEINDSINANANKLYERKKCTEEKGNLQAGKYKLRYKVKYNGVWFDNVAERDITILPSVQEDDILDLIPSIISNIPTGNSDNCSSLQASGTYDLVATSLAGYETTVRVNSTGTFSGISNFENDRTLFSGNWWLINNSTLRFLVTKEDFEDVSDTEKPLDTRITKIENCKLISFEIEPDGNGLFFQRYTRRM